MNPLDENKIIVIEKFSDLPPAVNGVITLQGGGKIMFKSSYLTTDFDIIKSKKER